MRFLAIVSILCTLLISACSNHEESLKRNLNFETLEKLEMDQKLVINNLMWRIKDKKKDHATSERTRYWSPVFDSTIQYMATMNSWFDEIEEKLNKNKNYRMNDKEIQFLVEKIQAHNSDVKKIIGLINLEEDYRKKNMKELEKLIQNEFLSSLKTDSIQQSIKGKYNEEKIHTILEESDLCDLRTNVKCIRAEFNFTVEQILRQIDMETEVLITTYDVYSCIVASNSSALSVGQDLEIVAGIGEFSAAAKPRFFVSGNEVKTQEDEPFLLYKKKINESPGYYSIPITIQFLKPDGTEERITKDVKYQVLPKN